MTLSRKTAFLLLLAWALWLTAESWCLGPGSFVYPHDNADQIVPVTTWLTQSPGRLLHAESLPSMCGVARMPATAWINAAHPFFLVFPPWLAGGLFLILQRLVAGFFAFLVARDVFRLPAPFALLAGLLFPLMPCEHGPMRLMHQFNEPGFPFFLWAFALLPLAPGRALLAGVGLGVVAGLGMGPVDAMPFLLPCAVLAAVVLRTDLRGRAAWTAFLLAVLACAGVAALIKLPTLLAMAGQAAGSHRANWNPSVTFLEVVRLRGEVSFRLLARFWPLALLALAGLFRPRAGRPGVALLLLFVTGAILGPLLQALVWTAPEEAALLKGFDFTRFSRVLPFALLLAGLSGLRNLVERDVPVTGTPGRAPAVAFALVLGVALHSSWSDKIENGALLRQGWTWAGLYGNADLKALAGKAKLPDAQPFRCATPGAFHEYHPLYLLASDLETADGYAVIYPNRYRLYWRQVLRPLLNAEPDSAGYFTHWGSRAYLFHSMQPWNASLREIPFADWYDLDLLSLANVRYLVSRKPVADPRLRLLAPARDEQARDQWAALPWPRRLLGYFAGRNPGPRRFVYENPEALPRFFLAEGTRVIDSHDALGEAPLAELSTSVFLLRSDATGLAEAPPGDGTPGGLTVAEYTLERSVLRVSVTRPCWIVNTSLWYAGSRCTVDGVDTPVVPAYGAFQTVRLTPGEHQIVWQPGPAAR